MLPIKKMCVNIQWCIVVKNANKSSKATDFSFDTGVWWIINLLCVLCFRLTLSEADSVRREGYKQQQVVHFMVERNPSQTLKLGSYNGDIKEHHLPFLKTTGRPHQAGTEEKPALSERVNNGMDKQEVTATPQDLRKSIRVNFRASSLMSSPRETSHRVQRREWCKEKGI